MRILRPAIALQACNDLACLRQALSEELGSALSDVLLFAGDRCRRISDTVLQRLQS
jgi:hypothetical protein